MKTQFSLFGIPKAILVFVLIGVVFVYGCYCYVVFQANYVTQRMWEVLDRFDQAHVFMIDVAEAYIKEELPFEKGEPAHQFIEKMVVSYANFVVGADDRLGDKEVQLDDTTDERLKQLYEQRYPEWSTNQTVGEQQSANPAPK